MAEYTREMKITVVRDTNKDTYTTEYTEAVSAIVALAHQLRGNEEALIAIRAIANVMLDD